MLNTFSAFNIAHMLNDLLTTQENPLKIYESREIKFTWMNLQLMAGNNFEYGRFSQICSDFS